LKSKINHYFLRREKKDVLDQLPKKVFIPIPLDLDSASSKKYKSTMSEFYKFLKDKNNDNPGATKLVLLGKLRQITSQSKLSTASELIDNIIEAGEKVLVFSCYNAPLEDLFKKYKSSSVMLTGKNSEEERKKAIESFQNNKDIKIFLGGMKSAGVGITLTEASHVIFIDYSWVPADHVQSMDRVHRPGQKADSVKIYQLYARNTIDEKMQEILSEKQLLFDELIGNNNQENLQINLIDELVEKIKNTQNT
jgi:SWI/SNF-related matrix-associated actin-dependent regulator 1 of chromatin subfamily A